MTAVVERVDSLEQTMQDFVRSVGVEFRKLYNSQRQTEAELRLFKDEMSDFRTRCACLRTRRAGSSGR